MSAIDPHVLVRAAAVYIPAMLTLLASAWRRPSRAAATGAMLAGVWNLGAVLALHLAARHWGWWSYDATGGLLLGMPVDLYLAWVVLWGVLPAIAFPALPLPLVATIALAFDLVLMPAAAPVVTLGPSWLVGEVIGLAGGLVPAQLLARWTTTGARLEARATLQVIAFAGLLLLVLPAVIIEGSSGAWPDVAHLSVWHLSILVQVLAISAVPGLSAVQEFVERGRGTPVPFDPPRRLVTTGVYAYVGNPMQVSASLMLLLVGAFAGNWWLAAGGVMAHVYSVGLAGWTEDADLRARFGADWLAYRCGVRRWLPRRRPWRAHDAPAARLYVAEHCGMCSDVARWFTSRRATGLTIVAAESHPSRALTRITYEPADGSAAASGVEALARALEHIHLGWAYAGFVLRLPGVLQTTQLLVDASGGEARRLAEQP